MRVLVINGLYPSKNNPMRGIYIFRNVDAMRLNGVYCDLILLIPDYTVTVKIIRLVIDKITNKKRDEMVEPNIIHYKCLYKIGLIDTIFNNQRRVVRSMLKAVLKQFKMEDYDLLHAHLAFPYGYLAYLIKKQTGIPIVFSAHGSDIHTTPLKAKETIPMITEAICNSDAVTFVSPDLCKTAEKMGFLYKNADILPMGVDTNQFRPIPKHMAREAIEYSGKNKIVGYIGSLTDVKNVKILPDIFSGINRIRDDVTFIVVGDGELKPELYAQLDKTSIDVIKTGYIKPEMVMFYLNAMDTLIIPSKKEGFGLIAIEALSCGCPVVASNVGGLPDIIGDTGVLVDLDENIVNNFIKGVCQLLDNPPLIDTMINRSDIFDVKITIEKQIEIYKSIMRRSSSNKTLNVF